MKKYIHIGGPLLRWNLDINGKRSIKLRSVSGVELLNLYFYGKAYCNAEYLNEERIAQLNESVHITTTGLIVRVNKLSESDANESILDWWVNKIFKELPEFLRYLRHTSNQWGLESEGVIECIVPRHKIVNGAANIQQVITQSYARPEYYSSRITWNHIKEAEKLARKKHEIPIYTEIFLDAINDRNRSEYRKAILYSAIAVESLLSITYEDYHNKVLATSKRNSKFRFSNHSGQRTDPIYDKLTRKTHFNNLLHEIPLYVLGKSLLDENEALYKNALRLYTTRNKIVHRGTVTSINTDAMLEVNRRGANEAVEIAIDLFEWVGIDKFSVFRKRGFIKIE